MPKKSKPTCDRWKPVRRGPVYCSPACGAGCLYEDYLQANIDALKLARRLGPEWKPVVTENMKWYYCAVSRQGHIKVHPNNPGFIAFFGDPGSPGGDFTTESSDPRTAVKQGLSVVQAKIDKYSAMRDVILACT